MRDHVRGCLGRLAVAAVIATVLPGCIAQQADLKQAERDLQKKIKQSNEEQVQTRARQSQEISAIREQELPTLRGDLDKALHQGKVFENRLDDLQAKLESRIEKRSADQDRRAAEQDQRLSGIAKQLLDQDRQATADRERMKAESEQLRAELAKNRAELAKNLEQMRDHLDSVQRAIVEAVKKTTDESSKKIDVRLEAQQKEIRAMETKSATLGQQMDVQNRSQKDQLEKINHALASFKEALTGLGDKLVRQEEATAQLSTSLSQQTASLSKRTDAMAAKVEADTKASTTHINEVNKALTGHLGEVNKSVASVAKALEAAGNKLMTRIDELENANGKFTTRFDELERAGSKYMARIDEQDRRLDQVAKAIDEVGKDVVQLRSIPKVVPRQPSLRSAQRPAQNQLEEPPKTAAESVDTASPSAESEPQQSDAVVSSGTTAIEPSPKPEAGVVSERSDKEAYERVLSLFKKGDLDGARQGFAAFLADYPNSELAPNARYWLGESYYGRKEFKQAIDAYNRVELDYPQSEKVPAALLKKGYAYLAMKDRKRASSAFRQVVTLYPKSSEAGKASDKLSQLKESR